MKNKIFIGGAWPYANNDLHIGHLAALLPADIIARFYRQNGAEVIYVSGTDCHGTPITERAKKEHISPKDIATKYHDKFADVFKKLDFSYDLYSNTMMPFHAQQVGKYLKTIKDNGYIYQKEQLQDYCENCNKFLSDREILGLCAHCGGTAKGDQCDACLMSLNPEEILQKKCSFCAGKLTQKPNKHLYFALSAFQDKVADFLQKNGHNFRLNAAKETQKYLSLGLVDRAITRQLDWGVDVPFENYADKKIYVWVEAVLGYLTAGELVAKQKNINFEKFLTDKNLTSYYVHGKDNIVFHSIIYPALLMALEQNYQLPSYIISSEFINMNDQKMSKSLGNLTTVNQLLEKFYKDTIRFYMIFNGPETKDVNFSFGEIVQIHNKFLVGVLGNFVNRNLSFICKKFGGKVAAGTIDKQVVKLTQATYDKAGALIKEGKLKMALETIMEYVTYGNKYYDGQKPWIQVLQDITAFNNTTRTCVYMMANIANLCAPFIPQTCLNITQKLGLNFAPFWGEVNLPDQIIIDNCDLLFERILN